MPFHQVARLFSPDLRAENPVKHFMCCLRDLAILPKELVLCDLGKLGEVNYVLDLVVD